MFADFNMDMWPIIVITYHNVKEKNFKIFFNKYKEEFLNLLNEFKNKETKGIILYNFNEIRNPDMIQGIKNMKFKESISNLIDSHILFTYMIVKNNIIRSTIKMIAKSNKHNDKLFFGKKVEDVLQSIYNQSNEVIATSV